MSLFRGIKPPVHVKRDSIFPKIVDADGTYIATVDAEGFCEQDELELAETIAHRINVYDLHKEVVASIQEEGGLEANELLRSAARAYRDARDELRKDCPRPELVNPLNEMEMKLRAYELAETLLPLLGMEP